MIPKIFLVKMVNRINTKNVWKEAARQAAAESLSDFSPKGWFFARLKIKKNNKRKTNVGISFELICYKNACLWSNSGSTFSPPKVSSSHKKWQTLILAFLQNMTTTGSFPVIFSWFFSCFCCFFKSSSCDITRGEESGRSRGGINVTNSSLSSSCENKRFWGFFISKGRRQHLHCQVGSSWEQDRASRWGEGQRGQRGGAGRLHLCSSFGRTSRVPRFPKPSRTLSMSKPSTSRSWRSSRCLIRSVRSFWRETSSSSIWRRRGRG